VQRTSPGSVFCSIHFDQAALRSFDDCSAWAIAIDANYGQALSVLATSHMFGAHLGWADIKTAAPIAERAALGAIQADSEDAWAHTALGSVYFSTRRLDHSLAEFELALQLNPNFSLAQGYYALALSYCGRWQESHDAARRAIRQSPRDPSLAKNQEYLESHPELQEYLKTHPGVQQQLAQNPQVVMKAAQPMTNGTPTTNPAKPAQPEQKPKQ